MKQLTILSGRCLVVELPEGATKPTVDPRACRLCYHVNGKNDWTWIPPGNWRIIGMLSEVTEGDVVSFTHAIKEHGCGKKVGYRDHNTTLDLYVDTALESLYSDIAANGYSFDTVLPKCECKPFTKEFEECPHINDSVTSCSVFEAAQSRVLCRERCLLLGRV